MKRRPSLRTQLMLLYAVPCFVLGAALFTVPLIGFRHTAPASSPPPAAPTPVLTPDRLTHFPYLAWSLSMAVLVFASLGLGWVVAGRFLGPLRAITATARDISASNLHRRLGRAGRTGELAELAETLDALFARLEAAFAAQRRFVANASHELRTPLTAQRALLQVALADPDATADSLRAAGQEVLALGATEERLIEALLTLASGERGVERPEPFDLAEVAGRVLASRGAAGVTVAPELACAPAVGDPRLVEILVANLVDNALRYNVPGGRVEVTTGTVPVPTGGPAAVTAAADVTSATAVKPVPGADVPRGARLEVRNSGPVVPESEVDRLFEPFQQLSGERTRHGGGHGLGLAIVRAIAEAHGARLAVRPMPAGGLHVAVTLPAATAGGQGRPGPGSPVRRR